MRKILFRGKRKDNGNWIYGTVVYPRSIKNENYVAIVPIIDGESVHSMIREVIPESVGQFTGLTDKNGKKIFEGDILKIAQKTDSLGTYYSPPLTYPLNVFVKWDMCSWMWETICEDKYYISFPDAWCHFECEVIGNIHDNPELLEADHV